MQLKQFNGASTVDKKKKLSRDLHDQDKEIGCLLLKG